MAVVVVAARGMGWSEDIIRRVSSFYRLVSGSDGLVRYYQSDFELLPPCIYLVDI